MTSGLHDAVDPAGRSTMADAVGRGALFEDEEGVAWELRGTLPDGRWAIYGVGREPLPLLLADPDTGFPQHPTERQIVAEMAAGRLLLASNPLDERARDEGRREERTREEVLAADPFAEVRMSVCRLFDEKRPGFDEDALVAWLIANFDWASIEARFGRGAPPASTVKSWVRKRGRRKDRRWCDMEDRKGQGRRAKRVTGHRLAIAFWHAAGFWTARRHPSVSKTYKDMLADVDAYNKGPGMIMFAGGRAWSMPSDPIKPADPEFFRQLARRLENRASYKGRWSEQAARQRWEGGGCAPEPVRYLEICQQDETEVPAFFFIDAINRVPLGNATWVILVDVMTHCILAWDLSFDAPSTVSWMRNVLNASMMKTLPREWAERFPDLATIGGKMSAIVYDNAKHLIGRAVEDAHGDLVQDVIYAGEGMGTHKGLVERTHETVAGLFAAKLPGAKMQIALAREFKMDPSKETLVPLEEGRLAMARAICDYHTTPLRGLGMRTPLDVWIEQRDRHGPQVASDQRQFARAIANVSFDRVLDNGGVVNDHLEYSDVAGTPRLMEACALHSHLRRRTRKPSFVVKVKPEPTMAAISVFDPEARRYVRLPAKKRLYAEGLLPEVHRLVLKHRAASSLMADPDGEAKLMEIRRLAETELRRICPTMEAAEKRARAAIMQQPAAAALLGDAVQLVRVDPSPTGLEVRHDMALDRADALDAPPRRHAGTDGNDLVGDPDPLFWNGASDAPPDGEEDPNGRPPAPDEDLDHDDDDVVGDFRPY